MSEDASLDSFATDDSDSEATDAGEDPDDSHADDLSSDAQVEPAQSTYEWSPERRECKQCGDAVERRWRDDETLVCQDCKEW